ncbi:MAG: DUF4847 family protein [Bacteroidaceae bacterium]|nr:DUF4847 family protein [Bacteroidaceae bacterium]
MKKNLLYSLIAWLILLTLPMMSGCSREDDVKIIFTGKVWKMSYIFREGNAKAYVNFWYDDREAEAASIALQKADGNYEIEFTGAKIEGLFQGAISAKGVATTVSGNWRADGDKQTLSTYSMNWSGEEDDTLAKQFQKGLNNAFKYTGDANALYIYYRDGEVTNVMALLPKNR